MKKIFKKLVFLLILTLFVSSCNDSSNDSYRACTEEFGHVIATVSYADGTEVLLDSIQTYLGDTKLIVRNDFQSPEFITQQIYGKYAVCNDLYENLFRNEVKTISVKGYRNGKVLFEEKMPLISDGCHLYPATLTQEYPKSDNFHITIKGEKADCSKELATIPLAVIYRDDVPVALDSYKVMWGDKDITPYTDFDSEDFKLSQKSGIYIIVNDLLQPDLQGKIEKVNVSGYIAGEEVFSEGFWVGATECHVVYPSIDKRVIVINK